MDQEIVSLKDTQNNIVKKAQQLITSRYTLTATEIKIISKLISMVKISDTSFNEYVFRVSDWKNEYELKRKNIYKAFEDMADNLLRKPLTIRSENGDWLKMNWVSSARYVNRKGIVIFKISDELKPYLLALKEHFLQYDISNILPLRSAYVIRLYELLKDWYNTGYRYNKSKIVTIIIDLRWLQQTFQISDKYKYADIKRRILLKAQSDLPKYTDIKFKFDEIKEGHRVTYIKFFITRKIEQKETINKGQVKEQLADQKIGLFLAMLPEQYHSRGAEKLLQKYANRGVEYVRAQIEYTNRSNPRKYLAYLKEALANDYAVIGKSKVAEEIAAKQEEEKHKKAEREQAQENAEERLRQQEEEEIQKLENYFLSLTKQEQDKLKNEALNRLKEKYPDTRSTSAKFGELSVDIGIKKILRERLTAAAAEKAQL